MAETHACMKCGKAFAAVMVKCPFCGSARAARAVPAPQSARPAFDFANLAEQAVAFHQHILPLEYHPAAILALDALLDQNYGPEGAAEGGEWKPKEGTLKAIAALGAFAGEVLRRAWGGAWQLDPERPEQILIARLVLPSGALVYPLSQTFNRAKSGAAQSLFVWYHQLRGRLNQNEGDASGWVRYGERFERNGRIDWASQFYVAAARISGDPAWIAKANGLDLAARNKATAEARVEQAQKAIATWEAEGERLLSERGARTDTGCMTLTALDILVRDLFGKAPVSTELRARHQGAERALGAFVGRVLCRQFHAQWLPDADLPPEQWSVGWDAGERAQPFAMLAARIDRGIDALVLGQVAAAIKGPCARGACIDPPEDPAAWFAQAQRFARTERYDWAVEFGRMALKHGADEPDLRFGLAEWLRRLGRFKEAAEHVNEGLARDNRRVDGWELCAAVMTALGDEARAKQAAEFAIKMRDKPWEATATPKLSLEQMVAAADELTNPSSALVAYAMINDAYPEYVEAWRERGVAHTLLGQPEQALTCFDRGIALEPRVAKSHDHKAALLGKLKRWEEAFHVLEAGLALCPGSKTLLQRKGIYCSLTGRHAEAVATFDAVLALFPGDAHTLKLRAEAAAKG